MKKRFSFSLNDKTMDDFVKIVSRKDKRDMSLSWWVETAILEYIEKEKNKDER